MLCISETWLESNIPDRYVNIEGFNLFRDDKGRGGGTCIYVRNYLNATLVNIELDSCEGIECTWVKVQCRKLPSVIVGAVYRHPNSSRETFTHLQEMLHFVCLKKHPMIALGDLNDDLLNEHSKLKKILRMEKLDQVIREPTRTTLTSKTLLDVIITNNVNMILSSGVVKSHISDHDLIFSTVNITKPKRTPELKTFRSLKNYTKEILCTYLRNHINLLDEILQTDDVNEQVFILKTVMNTCIDAVAPLVTKEIYRPPAPWINNDIKAAIKNRDHLRNIRDVVRDQNSEVQYKMSKKNVKSMMLFAKGKYNQNELKTNKKNIWKAINRIVPNKKTGGKSCNSNNPQETSEKFNSFFANVGRKVYEELRTSRHARENSSIQNENYRFYPRHERFRPSPVNVEKVARIVNNLKNTNSHGPDNITSRFLKDSMPVIGFYLTIIINTSIVTGKVPIEWKYSIVNPLYKDGDVNEPCNFRPISLLCIMSKVLEKVVSEQLCDYLETNNILSNTQHGFRKHLSTETALTKICERIYANIDENKISLLTLCDLSKAFDSVSHELLIKKMMNYGIDDFWFNDYLTARTQSVKINNHISSKHEVEYGVPQGSILGPILFNIFVNDLVEVNDSDMLVQYADDAQYLHSGTIDKLAEIIDRAERNLVEVNKYFSDNGLKMNANKTQFLFIGSRHCIRQLPENVSIRVNNDNIKPNESIKNLGVTMDKYFSFDSHIENIYRKMKGTLYFLNRNKSNFDEISRKLVIEALVMSSISYCSTVWNGASKLNIQKLQNIQNFASKVAIGNGKKYDHATPYINELEWLKIENKVVYDVCSFIYRILYEHIPQRILKLETVEQVRSRQTRQSGRLMVPRRRTVIADRAVSVRGPKLWNALPQEIKESENFSGFKKKLKSHLFTKQLARD